MKQVERENSEALLPASKISAAAPEARAERMCPSKADDMTLPCADLTCPCRIVRKR